MAALLNSGVCHARCLLGGKPPVQVCVEPKDKGSARVSPQGGVPVAKMKITTIHKTSITTILERSRL
jgi:hypothetical protein